MKITEKKIGTLTTILCWAMILFFVCIFFYINFSITPSFYCTDMYEDVMVSIEMWKEKTPFPSTWMFGNQTYTVATPTWAALFYGLTGNALLSMALASSVMAVLVLISFDWMVRAVFPRLCDRLVSGVVLISIMAIFGDRAEAVNGWQLLFTMCAFYACYAITAFLAFGCYLREGKTSKAMIALTVVLCFLTGIQSLRQTAITILPLMAMELLLFLGRMRRKEKLLTKTFWLTALFTAANLAGVAIGKSLPIVQQHIYGTVVFANPREYIANIWNSVKLIALLFSTGRTRDTVWEVPVLAVYVVFGVVCVLHYRKDKATILLYLLILSVLSVLGIGTVTAMKMREIYYFMLYPLAACLVALLFSRSCLKAKTILLGAITAMFFACCWLRVAPETARVYNRKQDISYRICADLQEKGITTVYSGWNHSEKIAVASGGDIIAGFWSEEDNPFMPVTYLCSTKVFHAPAETAAYIFYSQEEADLAIEKAERSGATMTRISEYPEEQIFAYRASINLMEYYTPSSDDE